MPSANPTADDTHQQLLESLDIAPLPKPFRNPRWKPPQRRNKNIKQVLAEASRKEAATLNSGLLDSGEVATDGASTPATGPVSGGEANIAQAAQTLSTMVLERNAQGVLAAGPGPTYTNVESAPSLHPAHQRHYCDITGLPAPYTDPKTRLRYHNGEVFGVIRSLGQGVAEKYLEARGAHVVLK